MAVKKYPGCGKRTENKKIKLIVTFFHPVDGSIIDTHEYTSFKKLAEDLNISVYAMCRYYKNNNGTNNMYIEKVSKSK